MGGGHRPSGRAHAGRGRRRGVDAPVRGHVGPGAGRRDRAGDVKQRGVAAVRGVVDKAPAVVSRPAVGRAGPAGGLHRRQGLPGPLHGDRAGDRHTGPETRAGPARRRHRDRCRHHRPAERPGDARTADGPDVAVRHRWRSGTAPGHHRCLRFSRRGSTLPSPQVEERNRPSARAAARLCRQGVAGCVEPRFGGPREARAGAAGRVAGARPPRRGGVDPRGTERDADRAAPRSDGGAATYAADDEHHRKPERQRRALHAQRQAVARRPDDSTLGGERAGGGGEALPAGPGLPRSAALGRALDALAPPDGVVADVA